VLCVLALYLGFVTVPHTWHKPHYDFPNYYMTARLTHEGYEMSRIYEWDWLEREKDHHGIDINVVGQMPITPFSTLALAPIGKFEALTAQRMWLLFNIVLVAPVVWLLRSLTGLSYQRVMLAVGLSSAFHHNLLDGQFYFVLLLLIVAACWAWLRGYSAAAGALIAIATACKLFPVLFFIFFLQRRDFRAIVSGAVAGLATLGVSIAIFGWNLQRTYLHEILPWTMHGEVMQPYITSVSSISSLLHYLLLNEPQWNPHPWHYSPLAFSVLFSVLPMLALAPAILLIRRDDRSSEQVLLEWSALLTATLVIATQAASYHFVLMIFPFCVLAKQLLDRKWYGWLAGLVIAYLGIGFHMPNSNNVSGLSVLLHVPRLPVMLAILTGTYGLLWYSRKKTKAKWEWTQYAWAAVMLVAMVTGVVSTYARQHGMREEYAYRLSEGPDSLLSNTPKRAGGNIRFVAHELNGYALVEEGSNAMPVNASGSDVLSFDGYGNQIWVEDASVPQSKIAELQDESRTVVVNGRDPMISMDGKDLAFVRDDHGRGRLMVSREFQGSAKTEAALTLPALNVYEATFHSETEYAFAAVENGKPPQIFLTDASHSNAPLALGETRYPALSPDGHWLAYSRLEAGSWNLWVRNEQTGETRRVADVPCNQIQPWWESDSKTLLYATDCGRSLWLTGLARRRVIP